MQNIFSLYLEDYFITRVILIFSKIKWLIGELTWEGREESSFIRIAQMFCLISLFLRIMIYLTVLILAQLQIISEQLQLYRTLNLLMKVRKINFSLFKWYLFDSINLVCKFLFDKSHFSQFKLQRFWSCKYQNIWNWEYWHWAGLLQ